MLTGYPPAAEQAIAETLVEFEAEYGDSRRETNRKVWLATRLRKRCLHNHADAGELTPPRLLREEGGKILEIEAFILAQHFHRLPEPERSALALFYIDLFTRRSRAVVRSTRKIGRASSAVEAFSAIRCAPSSHEPENRRSPFAVLPSGSTSRSAGDQGCADRREG
jgi:hypothetical protein